MISASFILNEETNVWEYDQMTLYNLGFSGWKLCIGKDTKVFVSIYDVLADLYREGYLATFRLPESMDQMGSKCW